MQVLQETRCVRDSNKVGKKAVKFILTGPAVKTGFNQSWWSIEVVDWVD